MMQVLIDFFLHWYGLVIVIFLCFLGFLLDDDGALSVMCLISLLFYLSMFCLYHFLGGVF